MMYSIYNRATEEKYECENARTIFAAARWLARNDGWTMPVVVKAEGRPVAVYTAAGWKWWNRE